VTGDKSAIDQSAQPGVIRRLKFQKRTRIDGVEISRMRSRFIPTECLARCLVQDLPTQTAITKQRIHGIQATEHPVPIGVPEKHRTIITARRVKSGVGLIGVLDERIVARVDRKPPGLRIIGEVIHGTDLSRVAAKKKPGVLVPGLEQQT
jgi:hypothetical protein